MSKCVVVFFLVVLPCVFVCVRACVVRAYVRFHLCSHMSVFSSYVCALMCFNACSHDLMYVRSQLLCMCVYSHVSQCVLSCSHVCALMCILSHLFVFLYSYTILYLCSDMFVCVCVIKKNTCTPICVLSSTSSFVCSHMSFISHVASCICSCICAPICELRDLFVLTCGVPDLNKDNNMCLILTRCTATKIPCCAPGSHTCPPSERWGRCACLRGYALGDRTEGR